MIKLFEEIGSQMIQFWLLWKLFGIGFVDGRIHFILEYRKQALTVKHSNIHEYYYKTKTYDTTYQSRVQHPYSH